jgi:hypothetical protein
MSEEATPKPPKADKAKKAKPEAAATETTEAAEAPAKAKKEKAPALEDKPFAEFIQQDYLPKLTESLATAGISSVDLKFEQQRLPIRGYDATPYWQVVGTWLNGQRQFHVIFAKDDIQAPKYFSLADNGAKPSTLESFMIDERKVSLDLLLLYTVQRLNGQKWLVGN